MSGNEPSDLAVLRRARELAIERGETDLLDEDVENPSVGPRIIVLCREAYRELSEGASP